MHENIKRYTIEGNTLDSMQNRDWLIKSLETQMRDEGYVPSIDLDPQYTLEFDGGLDWFGFKLSVYGVYIGEDESWNVSGVTSGKKIMMPTRLTK